MPTVELFATGDQIGTFSSHTMSGNANGVQVSLSGVQALGTSSDVFRIVVRQANSGASHFSNGQMVDIYPWPDTDPPSPPLYSSLNAQHDQFQGRASSGGHQIFTDSARVVFDVNGITPGNMQYGPGFDPPRDQQFAFNNFPSDPPAFPCFAAGTLIDTADGPRAVETLRPGDQVRTADHGFQPLRWIGQRRVSGRGKLAPILIKAGALDNSRDLLVSPHHRMLVRGWQAEMYFGDPEVLVAAKHLINHSTILPCPMAQVTYVHLAFDRHEVIFAEGCPSESLHLASEALATLDHDALAELESIFPELDWPRPRRETARACLRAWEGALVA